MKTPKLSWKVLDKNGQRVGAASDPYLAAAMVGQLGRGATIRYSLVPRSSTRLIWREGFEEVPANESFDIVADTAYTRARQWEEKAGAK